MREGLERQGGESSSNTRIAGTIANKPSPKKFSRTGVVKILQPIRNRLGAVCLSSMTVSAGNHRNHKRELRLPTFFTGKKLQTSSGGWGGGRGEKTGNERWENHSGETGSAGEPLGYVQ